jgi:hypothetical protein
LSGLRFFHALVLARRLSGLHRYDSRTAAQPHSLQIELCPYFPSELRQNSVIGFL